MYQVNKKPWNIVTSAKQTPRKLLPQNVHGNTGSMVRSSILLEKSLIVSLVHFEFGKKERS